MKITKYLFISAMLISTISYGQMTAGGGLGILTPIGQISGTSQFGLNLMGRYEVSNEVNIGANIGYFQNSNSQSVFGTTFKSVAFSVPISITAEYLFSNNDFRPYASADLGLFTFGARVNGNSSSSSYLTLAPGAGGRYAINRNLSLDFSLRYNLVFISNNTTGFLATNVGVLFAF